ncbi:MAG: alpha/beta hydrolase, partial [Nitrosomonadaceae bacterium]|nr:alpha/beta hydrolase [Nitrosomonadaceae bacterium]
MTVVKIPAGSVELSGELVLPPAASGVVLFAHGSGSSRVSPRNTYVASVLQQHGIGTLLFDLLTRAEDQDYAQRFDIDLLTQRLL